MNSRERVQMTLNHKEPDMIPFDLGATPMSGIHHVAYVNLRDYLGMPKVQPRISDVIQQLAVIDADMADRLQIDVRNVAPPSYGTRTPDFRDEGDYTAYTDDWGIDWRKPKHGGLYYDMYSWPLAKAETIDDVKKYDKWPDPTDPARYAGLRDVALAAVAEGKAVVMGSISPGVSEMHGWTRGYENYFTDFYLYPEIAEYIMDMMVDLKIAYWERALQELGDLVDVVIEPDDLAGQSHLLFSREQYVKFIKPRHTRLFSFIKSHTQAKILYHCDGALMPVLWDLIESGIDILNPLQKSAAGIDFKAIKKEYGKDLSIWGGGVDTQRVFEQGTPAGVRDDVLENIEALAPGGGWMFTTIHNTQASVPPENYMAMWETLQEKRRY